MHLTAHVQYQSYYSCTEPLLQERISHAFINPTTHQLITALNEGVRGVVWVQAQEVVTSNGQGLEKCGNE